MRQTTMPSPWREAAEKVGGVAALAAALGVGTATLHRWAQGKGGPPMALVRDGVNTWFKRRGLAEPFE